MQEAVVVFGVVCLVEVLVRVEREMRGRGEVTVVTLEVVVWLV